MTQKGKGESGRPLAQQEQKTYTPTIVEKPIKVGGTYQPKVPSETTGQGGSKKPPAKND